MAMKAAMLGWALLVAGCAHGGPPAQPAPVPAASCVVWRDGPFGATTVMVTGGLAVTRSLFGMREVAFMDGQGVIYQFGFGAEPVAVLNEGRLVLTGMFGTTFSGPIAEGMVLMSGPFGSTLYRYHPSCPLRDAALGAYALVALDREAAAAASAANRQRMNR